MYDRLRYDATEVSRCLVCHEGPCGSACPKGVPVADVLRSLLFENYHGAARALGGTDCADCDAPCERACLLRGGKDAVGIRRVFSTFAQDVQTLPELGDLTPDLSCALCGVRLENPFLLSSSVVASTYDMCARAFEAGWAGAAIKTICDFSLSEASPRFSAIKAHGEPFFGFKNIEQLSPHAVAEDLEIIERLHRDYPSKVIVASIMGRNEDEWARLAGACERAGASVVECNFSCPNMEDGELGITIGQSEELVERFSAATKRGTSLPVLAKLTPNVTDMVPLACAARRGGADGIATINTINSITGVDIDKLVAEPVVRDRSMVGGYSGAAVKPIALRFISDLAGCDELAGMHLSAMGGIQTWRDGLEFLLLGAGSLQVTTAVMQYGYRIIDDLLEGLAAYLRCKGVSSVRELVGAASASVVGHQEIERGTVVLPSFDYARCNGCGRCFVSCRDGGHQAIEFDAATRRPKLLAKHCVGCHLCRLVCPEDAIGCAPRAFKRA
jgi:dihydropyrimidine dehydrogenase (NAD+) subunit PreA